jgi:hypothetical protein
MRPYSFLYFLGILLFSLPASAVFVDGKNWMQVKETSFFTFSDVAGTACNLGTGVCSGNATNNQGTTLNLDGWTWASSQDIESLFEAVTGAPSGTFGPLNPTNYSVSKNDDDWADDFVDIDGAGSDTGLFDAMDATANENFWVAGVTRTVYENNKTDRSYIRSIDTTNVAVVRNNVGFDNARIHTGLWFYRTQSVPAPLTLFVLLPALGFLVRQRVQQNRRVADEIAP